MNEEVVARLGLDTGPFAAGLRSSKQVLGEFKKTITESFSEVGKSMAASLGFAAILEGGRKVLEFAEQIKNTSEALGVSTDFLQDFGQAAVHTGSSAEAAEKGLGKLSIKIGEARSGSAEAAKAFKDYGIALDNADGSGRSTEEIISEIANRMKDTASGTERAKMAMDLFGKSGMQLIPLLQQGAAGLDAFKNSMKLSKEDLEQLEDAKHKLDEIGHTALIVGGKVAGAIGKPFQLLGSIAGGGASSGNLADIITDMVSAMPKVPGGKGEAIAGSIDVKTTKEWVEAYKELNKAREEGRLKGANGDTKEVILRGQVRRIEEEIAAIKGDSVEKIKLQADLEKKQGELAEQQAANAKRYADDKKKANEERFRQQEKELAMVNEINDAAAEADKSSKTFRDKSGDRLKYSISDLANSHFNFSGNLGKDQFNARAITRLESQAQWLKERGFTDDAAERLGRADKLRGSLSGNVLDSERDPFKDQREAAVKSEQHLQRLITKAEHEGIKVVPVQGK